MSHPLNIGFDLDGVLLYNPARIIRPFVKMAKSLFLNKKKVSFFIPEKPHEILLWQIVHKSSLFISPGLDQLAPFVDQGQVKAHIITGRFAHLQSDTDQWLHRLNQQLSFTSAHPNSSGLQPHHHKLELIRRLKLDIFLEDNLDIVRFLAKESNAQIYWIANIADSLQSYPLKYYHLRSAIQHIVATHIKP